MPHDDASTLSVAVSEDDHWQGPTDAPVTLVEYGDYECPYCGRAYPIVKAVQQALGPQLRFVFRNFPLSRIHPNAQLAAEAAEAAGGQGRFWDMHDTIFEHQRALLPRHLRGYAEALHLDLDRFDRELVSGVYTARVRKDFASGVRSGVNGTPTFFINGLRHDGAWDADALLERLGLVLQGSAPHP